MPITTIAQARSAYKNAPPDSKWADIVLAKWIELCTTSAQAKEIDDRRRANLSEELSEALRVKWAALSALAIEQAVTPAQAKEAYHNCARSCWTKANNDKWEALSVQAIEQASTPAQARRAFLDASYGEARKLALIKWIQLCTTPYHARVAYCTSRENRCAYLEEEIRQTLSKWIELCKNLTQVRQAYRKTTPGSEEQKAAIRKAAELLQQRQACS
ncbi:MAG: hypothetical protein PHS62_03850 [Patescibacteria group bacterium]|nr:hypothetical protein [Patescibacteria group bacterium]